MLSVGWECTDSLIVHRQAELPVWLGPVLKYCHRDLSPGLLCLGVSFTSSLCGFISLHYQFQRKTEHVFLALTSLCAILELISVATGTGYVVILSQLGTPLPPPRTSVGVNPMETTWLKNSGGWFPKGNFGSSFSKETVLLELLEMAVGQKQQIFITELFWHPQNKSVVTVPRMPLRVVIMCHFLFIQQYVFIKTGVFLHSSIEL